MATSSKSRKHHNRLYELKTSLSPRINSTNWKLYRSHLIKWNHHVAAGKTGGGKNPKDEQTNKKSLNKHHHNTTRIESRNSNTQKSEQSDQLQCRQEPIN